jgi:hypothetical protein
MQSRQQRPGCCRNDKGPNGRGQFSLECQRHWYPFSSGLVDGFPLPPVTPTVLTFRYGAVLFRREGTSLSSGSDNAVRRQIKNLVPIAELSESLPGYELCPISDAG